MLILETKTGNDTFHLYNILYNKLTPEKVRANDIEPDHILTCSREQIVSQILKNDLIKQKDYSVIAEKLGKTNYVDVFLVIPKDYSDSDDNWDYAMVHLNFENELGIEWKH